MASWTEQELEDWLWQHPQYVGVDRWLARQFRFDNNWRLDLLGWRHAPAKRIFIAELKAGQLDTDAFGQVCAYTALWCNTTPADRLRMLKRTDAGRDADRMVNIQVRRLLVGESISDRAQAAVESTGDMVAVLIDHAPAFSVRDRLNMTDIDTSYDGRTWRVNIGPFDTQEQAEGRAAYIERLIEDHTG